MCYIGLLLDRIKLEQNILTNNDFINSNAYLLTDKVAILLFVRYYSWGTITKL